MALVSVRSPIVNTAASPHGEARLLALFFREVDRYCHRGEKEKEKEKNHASSPSYGRREGKDSK